jgi:hypothetical protein
MIINSGIIVSGVFVITLLILRRKKQSRRTPSDYQPEALLSKELH